jgi:hypothetical protein
MTGNKQGPIALSGDEENLRGEVGRDEMPDQFA